LRQITSRSRGTPARDRVTERGAVSFASLGFTASRPRTAGGP
jgi:hypothetical protein